MSLIEYAKKGNIEGIKLRWTKLKKENIQQLYSEMKDKDGYTVLQWAILYGNLEIVKLLISLLQHNGTTLCEEYIMMKDNYGETLLYWACQFGHLEIVRLLIIKGNLQKEDILLRSGSENNYGDTAYSVAKPSIKQLCNNVLFNGDINDMIKEIMVEL